MNLFLASEYAPILNLDNEYWKWNRFLQYPVRTLLEGKLEEEILSKAIHFLGINVESDPVSETLAGCAKEYTHLTALEGSVLFDLAFHSEEVALFAKKMGQFSTEFGLREIYELKLAALLHDIGKYSVDYRKALVLYDGVGTKRFGEARSQHPFIGAQFLRDIRFSEIICQAVEQHHNNFHDNPNVNSYAAIIRYCDIFSSAISSNQFKLMRGIRWQDYRQVAQDILDQVGEKYDPKFERAFRKLIEWLEETLAKGEDAHWD